MFAAEILEQLQHFGLDRHVQGGGRFIGDDDVGIVGQRHGDADALALTAGEFMGVGGRAVAGVGDADAVHQVDGAGQGFRVGDALVTADRFGDLLADGHQRVQGAQRVLEDEGDAVAAKLLKLVQGEA